jgi:hypothetical protein
LMQAGQVFVICSFMSYFFLLLFLSIKN